MPNHLHGIVRIREQQERGNPVGTRCGKSRRDVAWNVPTEPSRYYSTISPKPGSLGAIIRSFKSAATSAAHDAGFFPGKTIWQSRFHDHIIRGDVDMYMIRQYIELNPLMWQYDLTNPHAKAVTLETFERLLVEQYNITGNALHMILASKKMNRMRIV
jgi:REP element-mobilizing transposase RayT